jgi:uncharacterized protein
MENNMNSISAKKYYELLNGGLNYLSLHEEEVNDLNVFPIPDGDTGKNMKMTLSGGLSKVVDSNTSIEVLSKTLGDGMLMSARGNSGVILSQYFAGMQDGFIGSIDVTIENITKAFLCGVKKAYQSVFTPVEGTILTVIREASEGIDKSEINSLEDFFTTWLKYAKISLANTTNLLKELKEANVIDSGGQGVVYIVEGMYKTLIGEDIKQVENVSKSNDLNPELFTSSMELKFGYCTEVLVRLQDSKVDVRHFDESIFTDYLKTIGNSIVCFKTDSIIKVHVHTMTPYKVLEFGQRYGEFLSIKIENMMLQNEEKKLHEFKSVPAKLKKRSKYASVAVATGDGIKETFESLGVDYIIEGGQSKNPASVDFIEAFDKVNADNIFVFPNNSNIVLAATQAKDLYKKSNVIIIPTKNIGEGLVSLSMMDYTSDNVDEIEENFLDQISFSKTIEVSKAIRDANLNGVNIVKNNYIAISSKEVLCAENDSNSALIEALKKLNYNNYSFFIIVYGRNVSIPSLNKLNELLESSLHLNDVQFIDGGQDVYDYIAVLS